MLIPKFKIDDMVAVDICDHEYTGKHDRSGNPIYKDGQKRVYVGRVEKVTIHPAFVEYSVKFQYNDRGPYALSAAYPKTITENALYAVNIVRA